MTKTALITGGSSGIGAATAVVFAKEGCCVAICGRNLENLNKTKAQCIAAGLKESDVLLVKADMTIESDLQALVKETIDHFGQLDILVNNAGIFVMHNEGLSAAPLEIFDKIINTNIRGLVQLTKLCVPHLKAAKGSIVNVSSDSSFQAIPGCGYYCMAKAALDMYTRCLALELAPGGVRVNSVNPGVIRTDAFFHSDGLQITPETFPQFEKGVASTYPLGRIGEPEEVGKTIWFLATENSSFITGQILPICGGSTIPAPQAALTQQLE